MTGLQSLKRIMELEDRVKELEAETKRLLLDVEFRKTVTLELIEQRDAALAVVRQLREAFTKRMMRYGLDWITSPNERAALAAAAQVLGETK